MQKQVLSTQKPVGSTPKKFARRFFGLEHSFFVDFTGFLRRYAQTDVTSRFLAFFCFRCTYYHLCTTKNHQKYVHERVSTSLFILSILCTYVHACFVFPIYLGHRRYFTHNVGNRLKRVFPKFQATRSLVRGVNGRSKFVGGGAGLVSTAYRL